MSRYIIFASMSSCIRFLTLTLTFSTFTVMACFTPTRSKVLQVNYPDHDLAALMHEMHAQPYKGYQFKGRQNCINGMADIYPCKNIDLVGHLNLSEIGGGQGSDSWGWKDQNSGRYFALVGRSNGTSFVEITNPSQPKYIGNLPSTKNFSSAWRDIKTYQNYAFIVADNMPEHGMQVFDLNRLLTPYEEPQTFESNHVYTGWGVQSAHNIHINEATGFAYLTGSNTCRGGLHIANIQNPLEPKEAGCYYQDEYTHDVQCVVYQGPDSQHRNKEICFASNEDTLTIVDVSDKENLVQLSKSGYPGAQYVHQGWLTEDQRYFVVDDELDEMDINNNGTPANTRTYVFDLTDLDAPSYKGFHQAAGASIDHNQYVVDGHTFQANYVRGLRVLELGNLSNAQMSEVAYFDTHPETPGVSNFSGAWNVYPFFDNGMVIVSDVNRGVFILKPKLSAEISIHNFHTGLWYNTDQSGHGLSLEVLPDNRMAVYWYTYDSEGNQMWLAGTGSYEGNTATLDVIRTSGAQFPPAFNTQDVQVENWGQFHIEFTGCNDLTFSWSTEATAGFDSGSMNMSRLTFIDGLSCQEGTFK